ncbi:MAG: hypothetical protein EXR74_05530 [Bdellovibrionales bacterium]|nr:hypothetical protein [Bdellovibrionales bacterium]
MKYFILILWVFSLKAVAFIPPISAVLKEIFDARKFTEGTELTLNHRVVTNNGEWSEIEEKILLENRGMKFIWKPMALEAFFSGQLEKRTYWLGGDKKIPSRSLLFLKSYTAGSAMEFRDALVGEKFLKWDQMKQFKEGFEPQGDPQTWNVKSQYLEQEAISLALLPTGPSIAVVGFQDGNSRKTVYFDKGLLGIKKIEWSEGKESISWNFDQFSVAVNQSLFPRKANLIKDGRDIIQSELIGIRQLSKRQWIEWMKVWQKANQTINNSPASEETIRILLSFR